MRPPYKMKQPPLRIILLILAFVAGSVLLLQGCKSKEKQARYGVISTKF